MSDTQASQLIAGSESVSARGKSDDSSEPGVLSEGAKGTERQQQPQQQPVLGLPAPPSAAGTGTEEPQTSFKLDHLGPVIVNTDGTISRISGWSDMSEVEQARSLRLLAKRNNARMQTLRNGNDESRGASGQGAE